MRKEITVKSKYELIGIRLDKKRKALLKASSDFQTQTDELNQLQMPNAIREIFENKRLSWYKLVISFHFQTNTQCLFDGIHSLLLYTLPTPIER